MAITRDNVVVISQSTLDEGTKLAQTQDCAPIGTPYSEFFETTDIFGNPISILFEDIIPQFLERRDIFKFMNTFKELFDEINDFAINTDIFNIDVDWLSAPYQLVEGGIPFKLYGLRINSERNDIGLKYVIVLPTSNGGKL